MDPRAKHARCCAGGEGTKGHYGVARQFVNGVRVADSTVELKKGGLIKQSRERPADIYTTAAVPGRVAALDVRVSVQDAAGAGDDCCAKKIEH